MTAKPRHRPGDQPLPVPGRGRAIHDLVVEDLLARPGMEGAELFRARKILGQERYGSILQAFNGRSGRQDLLEELADATVYARQLREEQTAPAVRDRLQSIYWALLFMIEDVYTLDLEKVHPGTEAPRPGAPGEVKT
jgi:hypothetical protein